MPGRQDLKIRILESNLTWQEKVTWANRVYSYCGKKGMNEEYLMLIYNNDVNKVKEIRAAHSENFKGENNPAYQHGGRLSVYSKNNPNYSKQKAKLTAKLNSKAQLEGSSNRTLKFWENRGYSSEEAIEMLKKQQSTFSLEKCIEKYGEEEGVKRWNARQEKWLSTLNSKSEEERESINRKKASSSGSTSKAEKHLFKNLRQSFPELQDQKVLFEGKKAYVYDICLGNKIIEYHGDYWHCNPNKYKEDFFHKNIKLYAKDIWEKDKKKIKFAEENGYEILVIWESNFKEDKEKVVEECLNYLRS